MRILKTTLVPDEAVPEFKSLCFEVAERPLGEVLLRGLYPLGLASTFDGFRDTSKLVQAVADRLNKEEHILSQLKDFGHSFEVKPPTKQYGYSYQHRDGDKEDTWEDLEHIAKGLYFSEGLTYPEIVEIARRRLARNWRHELAKGLLTGKLYAFNAQRRFLKARSRKVKLRSREDMDNYDLSEILSIEDFKDDDKLLVKRGIPGSVNFRRPGAIREFTTPDGLLSLTSRIRHFDMRIYEQKGGKPDHYGSNVRYTCQLQDDDIRFVPELNLSNDRNCRERAREFAHELASGGGRYCFNLEIKKVEKLLDRARIRFPSLDYSKSDGGEASLPSAGFRKDVAVKTFAVGPVVSEGLTNGTLAKLLREYGEKASGIKEQLAERMAELLARLYEKSEKVLDGYFRQSFIRLKGSGGPGPEVFEPPIDGRGLRHSVVALYVLKHLRGSRILSSAWENTAYSVEDLARALIEGRVSVDGVFVKTA